LTKKAGEFKPDGLLGNSLRMDFSKKELFARKSGSLSSGTGKKWAL